MNTNHRSGLLGYIHVPSDMDYIDIDYIDKSFVRSADPVQMLIGKKIICKRYSSFYDAGVGLINLGDSINERMYDTLVELSNIALQYVRHEHPGYYAFMMVYGYSIDGWDWRMECAAIDLIPVNPTGQILI